MIDYDGIVKALLDAENDSELDMEIELLRPVLTQAACAIKHQHTDNTRLLNENAMLEKDNAALAAKLEQAEADLKKYAHCWVCENQSGLFTCEKTEHCGKDSVDWQWKGAKQC